MVRKSGASNHRPVLQAPTNGNPPPSTIAAQIVDNASKVHDQREPESRRDFERLLDEYLNDPATRADEPDSLLLNVLFLVTQAGLDVLLGDNPFGVSLLLPTAVKSISAIRLTIELRPHLLLNVHEPAEDGTPRPPLFISLIPKLLGLLGESNLDVIQDPLQQLLVTFFDALNQTSSSWRRAGSIGNVYSSCIASLIMGLAGSDEILRISNDSIHIPLPPLHSISELWPESQQFVALPQGTQRIVATRSEAVLIGMRLLHVILQLRMSSLRNAEFPPALLSTSIWMIDGCLALWGDFQEWSSHSDRVKTFDSIESSFLRTLELLWFADNSLEKPSHSLKLAISLSHTIAELLRSPSLNYFSLQNQLSLASLLTRIKTKSGTIHDPGHWSKRSRSLGTLVADIIEPAITDLCQNVVAFCSLQRDLQLAICLWTSPGEWPAEIKEVRDSLCSSTATSFSDGGLQNESIPLVRTFKQLNVLETERPLKRQKVSQNEKWQNLNDTYASLVKTVKEYDQNAEVYNLSNLHSSIADTYRGLKGDFERCELLSAFGRMACAGSKSLTSVPNNSTSDDEWRCGICDDPQSLGQDGRTYWNTSEFGDDWKEAIAALLTITELEEFKDASRPRIMMALVIGRVFNHISDAGYLNLETCSLGQWLLGSLNRSLRELRVAAARALMVFLRSDVPKSVRGRNRMSTLEFFHSLSTRERPLSELITLIMAYGQAARVCGEDELPIILLRLVEFLGHTNSLVCNTAIDELAAIAEAFNTTPFNMMRPYWRSIGVAAIQDTFTRPQKMTNLADLVGRSVNDLNLDIQSDVVPHMVLMKQTNVLQRIANSRGKDVRIEHICSQPRQTLAGILALLLCQPVPNWEANAWETLITVAPSFGDKYNLAQLVQLEAVLVACEILKSAADQSDSKKAPYHRAFYSLAALAETKHGQKKAATKKSLNAFLEAQFLGIMANFSEVLDAPRANQPLLERKRCVGAIGEIINLAKDDTSLALPQIRACLQSAIADPHLCDQTFFVWSALLEVLLPEDLPPLIDQTFALIAENWNCFSDETKLKANATIAYLHQKHERLLIERVDYLPSLAGITMLCKWEKEISHLKVKVDKISFINTFSNRCGDENAVVVRQALKELIPFLEDNQNLLHESAVSQKPFPALPALARSLLDACVRFSEGNRDIPIQASRCLGLMGGLDPYKVETVREKKTQLVLSNFERASEVIDFTAFLLEHILVKVFHSTTNSKMQGYLAYVMQELCKHCGFSAFGFSRPRSSQPGLAWERWEQIPEAVRNTLAPFLSSKYIINARVAHNYLPPSYPIFSPEINHSAWLRTFVYDLLVKGKGANPEMMFPVLSRIIRGHDISIAMFMLPYAALNVIITGDEQDTINVGQELLAVLETEIHAVDQTDTTIIKQCSENVFQVLDYLNLWLQEKRKKVSEDRAMAGKTGRGISEDDEIKSIQQISSVERILQRIPAEVVSKRSVECGSYSRALFHWEKYYRQEEEKAQATGAFDKDELLHHLQLIYAQIDEPDSVEGISAHLQILNPEQQIMEHRKAGRWTAAQSWYEIALAEKPGDPETQINLLTCLKESGQYDSLLNYVDGFLASKTFSPNTLPFAAEAAWSTGKWDQLERILKSLSDHSSSQLSTLDFNVGIGHALLALRNGKGDAFKETIETLREAVASGLSLATTASLHACHDSLVKLHVLYEVEAISGATGKTSDDRESIVETLDRRLDVLGAYTTDKQYLLGIRRAVMQLSSIKFTNLDIASAWLTSARLARKADFTSTAFNSVQHAAKLGDVASKIEYSKLMWKEGHRRKAIQTLQGAIASNAFQLMENVALEVSVTTDAENPTSANKTKCHAQLLLTKWLDRAGQTKALALKQSYSDATVMFPRWDKGHYYLGRHYNKLLEAEKARPIDKQSSIYRSGEHVKYVVENYIRSTIYGTRHYYQTLPKILTLWLDLGMAVINGPPKGVKEERKTTDHRVKFLDLVSQYIKRYTNTRMPAYAWYVAFPQIITRISHPHRGVWEVLQALILHIASHYPQQALWSLLAVTRATQEDRQARGIAVLKKLKEEQYNIKRKHTHQDLKTLIIHGQRLTDALLAACDAPVEQRVSHVSLARDLGFNHKLAPCHLVVPIEATMTASLPPGNDSRAIRNHNPFPQDAITISSFKDDVLVLSSLQRPRKVTVIGSDGRSYGLLCKPKDDLRKDQRLMEFNAMINRALQRDIECSKRRLYIKTYGVTPLNEECGTIEWVEGLKPLRDILLRLYRQKNTPIDYSELRILLNEACTDPSKVTIFTHRILKKFPAVLHEWFVESYPEPEVWFNARLRYTRSCAVMSIVGHVLGLGDRHGENILLEEGNGGTFHVDFNCLFDKGLTFEKPETVPFRLTHNMVDAMGPQGVEGPFRTAAELTYSQLRTHEDTLITILETFVHDPTADFLDKKKKRKILHVPDTPQEVLESVKGKVAGLLQNETVPLSVEGYVDALIAMARDPVNLAAMYIGWCAFF
ncbi:hypothetical protein B0J11DRAFT_32467 [Dendryphion nanum]|uniref:non-specific serine/threonine protein kinase n=1 Tax=Dendryphion nanum TaxID=256645 RepID=A0A9P9EIS5_9PLEO|nr:hypothetical protein B0J11DRAFT_32467 [Dendryphion nanum]